VVTRATNTKVNIELISETPASIVVVVRLVTSIEMGSFVPKLIPSTKSTGIKKTYLKFSLIHLLMVSVPRTTPEISVQL